MKSRFALSFLAPLLLVLSAFANSDSSSISLGTAANYSVLAGSTVTNTGTTTLNGDVGVSPGAAVTGSGSIVFTGKPPNDVITTTSAAATAQGYLTTAYTDLSGLTVTKNLGSGVVNLGGQTLGVGVYDVGSAGLTGLLTLNFAGKSNENIVFIVGALNTANGPGKARVLIENAGSNDNVYWVVGSSAVIGTYTSFEGNILALTSITLDTGASIGCGSALARNGAVTLDDNVIGGGCSSRSGGGGGGGTTTVPEPGTVGLLATGLALLAGVGGRRLRI